MIRNRLKPRPRALFLEGLESRQLMAVVAGFSPRTGALTITGDSAANTVAVTAIPGEPGGVLVTGLTPTAAFPAGEREFFGVRSVTANLNGGEDHFTLGEEVEPIELLGNVTVNLGQGHTLGLPQTADLFVNTLGAVNVTGGALADVVTVDNSLMLSLTVTGAGGDDTLNITDSVILLLNANLGVSSVRGAATDDDVLFTQGSAIGSAIVSLGTASTGGENEVDVQSTIFGSLNVIGGNRADDVYLGAGGGCGIGDQLVVGLVDLVDDLEPLLEGILGRVNIPLILNQLDGLLASIAGPLDLDLNGFDFNEFFADGDLSLALENLFTEIAEELDEVGLTFCDIGAQTTLGSLNVSTGAGDDDVEIGQEFDFDLLAIPTIEELLFSAANADVLILTSAIINTGDGSDEAFLGNVFVGTSLTVLLGTGNDFLELEAVTAAIASLNGGEHRNDDDVIVVGLFNENLGYIAYYALFFETDTEEEWEMWT